MSKGLDQIERAATTRTSDFARVSENDVNVCKQISSLYDLSLNRDEEQRQLDIRFCLARFQVTPVGWGSSTMFVASILKLHRLCIHSVSFIRQEIEV